MDKHSDLLRQLANRLDEDFQANLSGVLVNLSEVHLLMMKEMIRTERIRGAMDAVVKVQKDIGRMEATQGG